MRDLEWLEAYCTVFWPLRGVAVLGVRSIADVMTAKNMEAGTEVWQCVD